MQKSNIIREARDPHHGGCNTWGFDGNNFWHKTVGSKKWVKTSSVHPTPARIAVLAELANPTTPQARTP